MSHTEALGGHLPKISQEEVRAIRRSQPAKLLGGTAFLLSLLWLVVERSTEIDQKLEHWLGIDLSQRPWLRFGFVALPLLAVASHSLVVWRAERSRRALQRLAIAVGAKQSGYFRIGPYTTEDRERFDRADRAQDEVLRWIERSVTVPLYLIGDSGSGKSSLLSASVVPTLRERGWTVVEVRAWQDPEAALSHELTQLLGGRRFRAGERRLRRLLEAVARRGSQRLLIILDQFEEFVILGKPEQQGTFAALLAELRDNPMKELTLMLVLRSEYQAFLEDIGLPLPGYRENLYSVRRFTFAAASDFLGRSGLELQPAVVDRLLTSAAELDETPGLVRPITLNVIGYVLAAGKTIVPSLDAAELIHRYIEQAVGQPAIRDFAPQILEQLVTEQATKRPRSEQQLVASSGLRRGEIRAVLNGLHAAALARPLDPTEGVWELSHDFVARAVARHLGRSRRDLLRRSGAYAAPAFLMAMILVGAGVIAWNRLSPYKIRTELAELGLTVTPAGDGLIVEPNSQLTSEAFAKTGPLLAKLGTIQRLVLSRKEIETLEPLKGLTTLRALDMTESSVENLEPLKDLSELRALNLSETRVKDLNPLKTLTKLQWLNLTATKIADLEPLSGLTALQTLVLIGTEVDKLEPLKGLTALQWLNLPGTRVENLEPLIGLTGLQVLDLNSTRVEDLESLRGLNALKLLDLTSTKVENLDPLKDLSELQTLILTGTAVQKLQPIKGLIALQELYFSATRAGDLEPLKDLTKLHTLVLAGTPVEQLEPLKGLTALKMLYLNGTKIVDVGPLKDLTKLQMLYLSETKIEDLEPLRGLTAIHILDLSKTAVASLEPLKGLSALQTLVLSGTKVQNIEPLKGLTALQTLELRGTNVVNLESLKDLPALRWLILSGSAPEGHLMGLNRYREEHKLAPVRSSLSQ